MFLIINDVWLVIGIKSFPVFHVNIFFYHYGAFNIKDMILIFLNIYFDMTLVHIKQVSVHIYIYIYKNKTLKYKDNWWPLALFSLHQVDIRLELKVAKLSSTRLSSTRL